MTSYTANGNGTVTDNVTGLLWQAPQATLAYTWDSTGAATGSGQYYCAHLSLAGRASGWRLPTLPELFSLVDNTGSQPTINTAAFPGTTAAGYWTSTQESPGFGAWVDFINGDTSNASSNSGLLVRCVQ